MIAAAWRESGDRRMPTLARSTRHDGARARRRDSRIPKAWTRRHARKLRERVTAHRIIRREWSGFRYVPDAAIPF